MKPLHKALAAAGALLLVTAVVVNWPSPRGGAGFPPPITLDEAKALPDDRLVQTLVVDLSHRMYRKGYNATAWKALPEAAKNLWVTTSFEPRYLDRGLLFFLITYEPGTPDLADLRDVYNSLGAVDIADALDKAVVVEGASGREAAERCLDYQRGINAPPFARPAGFTDPFAATDPLVKTTVAKSGINQRRLAYAKEHLAEIVQK